MKYYYFLFFIAIYSCKKSDINTKTGKIVITEKFRIISVDENTPTHLKKPLNVFVMGSDTLLHFTDNQNTIHFLSFSTQEPKFRLNFDYNGPNGVGSFYKYYFHNFDSIFVNRHMTDDIYLLDSSGQVIDKMNYLGHDVSASFDGFKIYHEEDSVFGIFASSPAGYWLEVEPLKSNIFIKSMLNGKNYKALNYVYPKSFEESKSSNLSIYPVFTENKIIVGFKGSHQVFVLNTKNNKLQSKKVESKFSEGVMRSLDAPNINEHTRYAIQHLSYSYILWDKYKKVYYRFVKLPYMPKLDEDLNSLLRYPPKFSLMVLDENLNILAEKELKSRTYELRDSFVTPEGLWVSTHHPANPNIVEDQFRFQLVQFEF